METKKKGLKPKWQTPTLRMPMPWMRARKAKLHRRKALRTACAANAR